MSPYFSIITPTFNRALIIGNTIKSVLKQDFLDFEYIIVDDGSKDDTEKVINTFDDKRLIYLKKDNGERGAARNYGVKNSKGKYVFFLDSDDAILPFHLTKAFHALKSLKEPEFFYSRYSIVDEKGREIGKGPYIKNPLQEVLKENPFACLVFLRADIALKHPFKEERELQMLEDWLLWLQLAARFPFYFNNEITCAIGMHDSRSMAVVDPEKLLAAKDIMVGYLKDDKLFCEKYGDYVKIIEANLTSLAALQASLQFKPGALSLLKAACRFYPLIFFKRRTYTIIKNSLLRRVRK